MSNWGFGAQRDSPPESRPTWPTKDPVRWPKVDDGWHRGGFCGGEWRDADGLHHKTYIGRDEPAYPIFVVLDGEPRKIYEQRQRHYRGEVPTAEEGRQHYMWVQGVATGNYDHGAGNGWRLVGSKVPDGSEVLG